MSPRTLHLGSTGKDVEAAKRAVYRYVDAAGQLKQMQSKPLVVRRFFGPGFAGWVNEAHARAGQPRNGTLGPKLWEELRQRGAIDAYARSLLDAYDKEHQPVPQKPPLVEPRQGFGSLDERLWEAYSMGRRLGLSDLGTYNPASRLPGSGNPSDHATGLRSGRIGEPVVAFDLGFSPWNLSRFAASKFFNQMVGRPEIAYVIKGNQIWSRERGLHAYTHGGHESHIHTSGDRR